MTEMTKRSSSILTSRWTSRRVEAEVGGEVEDVEEKKAGMAGAGGQGRTKLLKLHPYHKTAHFHMTLLSFLTITSTESFSHRGTFLSLDCGIIHITASLLDHFALYGPQGEALKGFILLSG